MSRIDETAVTDSNKELDFPLIAFVGANGEQARLVRNVLRARRHGFRSLVIHDGCLTGTDRDLLEYLDAIVVEGTFPADDPTKQLLELFARPESYPGLVLAPAEGGAVDFEASLERFEASTDRVVEAVTEPILQDSRRVAIAIPAYNESETIATVVSDALNVADVVLVVDDGSDDETGMRAAAAGAAVVSHGQNRGYGASLKTAFAEAQDRGVTHLVTVDGDGQHNVADVPKLVSTLEKTAAEVVIGSRFVNESNTSLPLYRWVGLTVINVLTNLSQGVVRPKSWVKDTQCGFRAYDQHAIESLAESDTIGDHMSASIDILTHAHRRDLEIAEVDTVVRYDVENASTHHPLGHGLTLIRNLFRTVERERPITAFGVPGFALVLLGSGFAYWTVTNYFTTQTFPIGLAMASVFFGVFGVLLSQTAVVLHSLAMYQNDT